MSVLDHLERVLAETEVHAELLLVGGAVMSVVFRRDPPSRRPGVMFGDPMVLEEAVERIADRDGLPPNWLDAAVRELVGVDGVHGGFRDGPSLRVFGADPSYALAMKALELGVVGGEHRHAVEADLRYLVRLLGLRDRAGVQGALERLIPPSRLPEELEAFLGRVSV